MEREICNIINKGAILHKRLMTKILEQFDLTYAQYQVLKIIKQHNGLTAKEILIYLDTDKATLSGVLSRLEKHNLIERIPNQEDRRLMHIHLKEKSIEICDQVNLIETNCESDLLKGLKPKEIRYFFDVFNHIIGNQLKKLEEANKSND
ncbi:MarR family winged helix-turn-helix transcriptional regulator [Liberiplasma polymorphum]|uniref:MarR family winged helix-turn-helix transcriptional regulator n=1 Tax=Liberiplasma polymorphum TaxID=3374570 RepID=UPI00377332AD